MTTGPSASKLLLHVAARTLGPAELRLLETEVETRRPAAVIVEARGVPMGDVRRAVEAVQRHDVAALLLADVETAHEVRADGLHVAACDDALAAYGAARAGLGPELSIGVDVGASRHMAMEVGEAGADYVAFGSTAAGPETRNELISWWAELFEVPCVALDVESDAEAERLIASGADFVVRTIVMGE